MHTPRKKPTFIGTHLRLLTGSALVLFFYAGISSALGRDHALQISLSQADGSYSIGAAGLGSPVLHADVAVELDGHWLYSSSYPRHSAVKSTVSDDLGSADEWSVTFFGLSAAPSLEYRLRSYPDKPFGDIQVIVHNGTPQTVQVQSVRVIAASGSSLLNLGGPASKDRILSDSFSEDRPAMQILDLADTESRLHRGVGSQLIYNRQSQWSFFVGALTSDRFLSILRLHITAPAEAPQITAYEVDSTGTTELAKENSLRQAAAEDQIPLRLSVAPGSALSSERVLFSIDTDYHRQLETYGSIVRRLHNARVTAPNPMGWWSWTAYYFGLSEGTALANAQWLATYLRPLGFDFFHIDEGYQYARGDYSTANATLFPSGMAALESKVRGLGLVPGIWTAPFEVSERSSVYQTHPDWLVHNAAGKPIQAGWVTNKSDRLFVLDCTNPGAQDYLRNTYSVLVNDWGIRYIKMDFMEDSAIEGIYYLPNTTAMQAQRMGLGVIREAVGDDVLLDKDGSVMLNPVGYVDFGRTSQDTGHTFEGIRDAATGIAARYYMNRNFFVADPDAFTVSTQTVDDQSWQGGTDPLTLDEAGASIALSAVSGGIYEIGDDLPTLGAESKRLALVQNKDLIAMARLGRSSIPMDLMTYSPEDRQPSVFLLKEDTRQSVLTVFNWTDTPRTHSIVFSDLGLAQNRKYNVVDVFDQKELTARESSSVLVNQPAHSVRVLKIVDASIAARAPRVKAQHPSQVKAGVKVAFGAQTTDSTIAVVEQQWDFGDGIVAKGARVAHAYTHAGNYTVTLTAVGLDGLTSEDTFVFAITGSVPTNFVPDEIRRYEGHP